jgi:hypothetical protein
MCTGDVVTLSRRKPYAGKAAYVGPITEVPVKLRSAILHSPQRADIFDCGCAILDIGVVLIAKAPQEGAVTSHGFGCNASGVIECGWMRDYTMAPEETWQCEHELPSNHLKKKQNCLDALWAKITASLKPK